MPSMWGSLLHRALNFDGVSSVNVLLIHGSSEPTHAQSASCLVDAVAGQLGEEVSLCQLGESLPQGARVMPLFLSEGKHLREDVPAMLAEARAGLVPGPATCPEAMAELLALQAVELRGRCRAVLFALYRLLGATALSAALYRQSKRFPLPAVAALHGECSFADVLGLWQREGQTEAVVQPALLFPGASLNELKFRAAAPGMQVKIGEPLAELPGFATWIAARFREAT